MEAQVQITPEPTLAELVKALHEARMNVVAENCAVKELEDRFRAAYEDDFARRDLAREVLSVAEFALREAALATYDGEHKQIGPGVSIAVSTGMTYDYPTDKALAWALEHNQCLALDEVAFHDVCASGKLRPDFVSATPTKKTTVRLASDLSEAVEEWENVKP